MKTAVRRGLRSPTLGFRTSKGTAAVYRTSRPRDADTISPINNYCDRAGYNKYAVRYRVRDAVAPRYSAIITLFVVAGSHWGGYAFRGVFPPLSFFLYLLFFFFYANLSPYRTFRRPVRVLYVYRPSATLITAGRQRPAMRSRFALADV